MTTGSRLPHTAKGFALVLTLALLALMVLALAALGLQVRLSGQISTATAYQVQAAQHARLGLAQAMGALQKLAGPDDRVTAMAGIAGAVGGSQQRHWCGVWSSGGEFLGWLTSGAAGSATPTMDVAAIISLVERRSVGLKPGTLSAYVDEEYVDAGKISIVAPTTMGPATTLGSYAFWVGDEGVKVSAFVPDAELPAGGHKISVASSPVNVTRMGTAYQEFDVGNAAKVLSYEQSTNLSYASGSKLTASNLRDSFHHVTVTHRGIAPGGEWVTGRINLNTTSAVVWRSILESYERVPGMAPFGTAAKRTSAINAIVGSIAGDASGKVAFAAYTSVEAFLSGTLLDSAITGSNGIAVDDFVSAMAPMLAVRSDTFRIRAYGEAVNRVDSSKVEAVAQCEAIVQRTSAPAPLGLGRTFVVTYFRWLGPDDI